VNTQLRSQILFAIFAWSLLILRFGYRFGTGDQVELLPYTLFLHDKSLYSLDFFIQGLHSSVPNERTVMASLLVPFVNHLEIVCFLLQCFSTLLLIIGLDKVASRFVRNKYLVWGSILTALIPLNDFTLGNVELYSECFQAGGLAVAIVIWAIHLFLSRRYVPASLLMSAATFIQLLDGLNVMLLLSIILLLEVISRKVSVNQFLKFIGLYACTAGVYLMVIWQAKYSSYLSNPADALTTIDYFKILFEFRHPHHFIFSSFPVFKVVVFIVLLLIGLIFYYRKSKEVFRFLLIASLGLLIYAMAVDVFQNQIIVNFQFYKISHWVKFFGVVALAGGVERFFSREVYSAKFESGLLSTGIICCWIAIVSFNHYLPYNVPFQIFTLKSSDDMITICEQIREITPKNAVFVQPFENTELKYYAQRASYVEFKANVRHPRVVGKWYHRIAEVYGVSYQSRDKGFGMEEMADRYYYTQFIRKNVSDLKHKGITHILTKREFPPSSGRLIVSNNTYAVYQL
jgi:hypothetical protein